MALLRHLGCLLLGLVVGLAALAVHRSAVPAGLLLGVATSLAVPWWLLRSRWPRTGATYVAGWLAVLLLAVAGRPEGDYVVAADLEGYVLLGTGFALVAMGIVSLAGGRHPST